MAMTPPQPSTLYAHIALPVPLHGGFDYIVPKELSQAALTPGIRVVVPFGGRKLVGILLETSDTSLVPADKLKALEATFTEAPVFSTTELTFLKWAAAYYSHPLGEVINNALPVLLKKAAPQPSYYNTLWRRTDKAFAGRPNAHKQKELLSIIESSAGGLWEDGIRVLGFTKQMLKKLEQEGYLSQSNVAKHSASMQVQETTRDYALTSEQHAASQQIKDHLHEFSPFLLEGVTGSGKTEVYIAAVRHCIEHNKQALVLVPEINLTPQTFKRFQSQLGIPVAVYHSGMSNKEKLITHQLFKTGQAQVLIGTRSSIFLPSENLGLIIVDEEHDASYKQADGFKYSARDLAVKRAQLQNCPVVLGSATPSSDTYLNAQSGKFTTLKLSQRANNASLPSMQLEDMRALSSKEIIAPKVLFEIKRELDQNNQVVIFQNRRGLAPSLMCFDCGWLCPCPNCDTRITVHQHPPRLHCHHCDHQRAIPQQCAECGSNNLNALGAGTEKLEQLLSYNFPRAHIVRLDRDEIKTQQDLELATTPVREGIPCLIIGTQMVTKGHDFPHVTLVVVVDADSLFFSSDFRALERGAQQLLQVAGRAGRGEKTGRVIIQTRQPEHPLFNYLRQHDYTQFITEELSDRQLCSLPPYSKLMSVRCEASSLQASQHALSNLKSMLASHPELQGALLAGPIAASIKRKQNKYRSYLHIFCTDVKQRLAAQQHALHFIKEIKGRTVRLSLDVDPIEIT